MVVKKIVVGNLEENCYFIIKDNSCIIVDPGDEFNKIDEIIKNSLINWTIDRVSKVNLTIVRLAIAEMLYINDVPEVVAINEAIELTKKYSDDKSVSFVNGALDKAFKNIK